MPKALAGDAAGQGAGLLVVSDCGLAVFSTQSALLWLTMASQLLGATPVYQGRI